MENRGTLYLYSHLLAPIFMKCQNTNILVNTFRFIGTDPLAVGLKNDSNLHAVENCNQNQMVHINIQLQFANENLTALEKTYSWLLLSFLLPEEIHYNVCAGKEKY